VQRLGTEPVHLEIGPKLETNSEQRQCLVSLRLASCNCASLACGCGLSKGGRLQLPIYLGPQMAAKPRAASPLRLLVSLSLGATLAWLSSSWQASTILAMLPTRRCHTPVQVHERPARLPVAAARRLEGEKMAALCRLFDTETLNGCRPASWPRSQIASHNARPPVFVVAD